MIGLKELEKAKGIQNTSLFESTKNQEGVKRMPLQFEDTKFLLGLPELKVLGFKKVESGFEIAVQRKADFELCPWCGKVSTALHSHWTSRVRDLPISGRQVTLMVTKRRFRCLGGCKPFSEGFGCFDFYQRQTKRFRDEVQRQCAHASIEMAAERMRLGYGSVDRIYYEQANAKAAEFKKPELPQVLGIDEFRGAGKARYNLALTDLSNSKGAKLLNILEEKRMESFFKHCEMYTLTERESVAIIVQDMDKGLRSWTKLMFPKAFHIADKFHVTRNLLKHMERVRKTEFGKCRNWHEKEILKGSSYLLRKRQKDLSESQKSRIKKILEQFPLMKEAYEFKEDFMSWYDTPKRRSAAKDELEVLQQRLLQMKHFRRFNWTLKNWGEEILNYFAASYTNGFTEGMNNKIKTLKRQCYGFRSFPRFRVRTLMECAA